MAIEPHNGASTRAASTHLPYRTASAPPPARGRWIGAAVAAFVIIAGVALFHFRQAIFPGSANGAAGHHAGAGPIPVVVATSKLANVDIWLTGLGTVTAYNTVTVHTRVDGELVKVCFTEGQMVKAGDLLAQIDPGPYRAALEQAQGQLLRDQALLKNAKLDLQRYQYLLTQHSITEQQEATQEALVEQYQGAVGSDQGQVHAAQVNLDYTQIKSPLDGRIGLRQVDQGNIVHANDASGLAVITQLQPIALLFGLPQEEIPQVMQAMKENGAPRVIARDKDAADQGGNVLDKGKLLTINNTVDMTTGNAMLKAEMPNKDSTLFPNQFANGWLLAAQRKQVVVVPTPAIQFSPTGPFVYVVGPDDSGMAGQQGGQSGSKVRIQPVTVFAMDKPNIRIEEQDQPDSSVTVVESQLSPGETVVVDGVDKLQDGTAVIPRASSFGASGTGGTADSAVPTTQRGAGGGGGGSGGGGA